MSDTLKRKVLVVHGKAIAGISKKTGKAYQMLSVSFMNTDTLSPFKDTATDDFGYGVITETLPYECKASLDIVPAFYNMEYEVAVTFDKDKKPITGLKPVGISFDSPLVDTPKK